MASQRTTPPEPADAEPRPEDAKPRVGEYLDDTPRTYSWPDGPQTAERGDVCVLPGDWEDDGRWGATAKKPTRLRDNHPDQFEVTAARQAEARKKIHDRLAKAAEGGERK